MGFTVPKKLFSAELTNREEIIASSGPERWIITDLYIVNSKSRDLNFTLKHDNDLLYNKLNIPGNTTQILGKIIMGPNEKLSGYGSKRGLNVVGYGRVVEEQ